ncbi:MAG: hypothetical protein K6V97_11100 [Actinomycetia bacterium]|nr:hypothetical protein [Actinomycetes bacterium]
MDLADLIRPGRPRRDVEAAGWAAWWDAVGAPVTWHYAPRRLATSQGPLAYGPFSGVVEAVYRHGLLLRADAGWRAFVTYVELYAGHVAVMVQAGAAAPATEPVLVPR